MKSSGPVVIRSTTSCWVTESLLVGRIRSIKHDSLTEHKAANKLNNYVCSWQRARPEFYHQIPNCSATARVSSDLLIYLRYRPEEFDLFFFSSPALRQLLTHSLTATAAHLLSSVKQQPQQRRRQDSEWLSIPPINCLCIFFRYCKLFLLSFLFPSAIAVAHWTATITTTGQSPSISLVLSQTNLVDMPRPIIFCTTKYASTKFVALSFSFAAREQHERKIPIENQFITLQFLHTCRLLYYYYHRHAMCINSSSPFPPATSSSPVASVEWNGYTYPLFPSFANHCKCALSR